MARHLHRLKYDPATRTSTCASCGPVNATQLRLNSWVCKSTLLSMSLRSKRALGDLVSTLAALPDKEMETLVNELTFLIEKKTVNLK